MTGLGALIRRNSKLYFKDKGMFFTSLITPDDPAGALCHLPQPDV